MRYIKYLCFLIVITVTVYSDSFSNLLAMPLSESKIHFWDQTQKSANIFNQTVTPETIKAAKAYGITFIRLAPDKSTWITLEAK